MQTKLVLYPLPRTPTESNKHTSSLLIQQNETNLCLSTSCTTLAGKQRIDLSVRLEKVGIIRTLETRIVLYDNYVPWNTV
jgi:hypothetical protein